MRWLLLPAAGAGLYALATNGSFTRKAKEVMNEAKERASDLPEDLVDRVQEAAGQTSSSRSKSRQSTQRGSASRSRSSRQRSRKTASAR